MNIYFLQIFLQSFKHQYFCESNLFYCKHPCYLYCRLHNFQLQFQLQMFLLFEFIQYLYLRMLLLLLVTHINLLFVENQNF